MKKEMDISFIGESFKCTFCGLDLIVFPPECSDEGLAFFRCSNCNLCAEVKEDELR